MSTGLLIFLIILFVVALIGTFYAFKQEEDEMKRREEEGETAEDEVRRSREYEESSLKSSLRPQLIIYAVTIVLSLVALGVYIAW